MRRHVAVAGTAQSNFHSASNETECAEIASALHATVCERRKIARQRFAASVEQTLDNLRAFDKPFKVLPGAPVQDFIVGDFKNPHSINQARDRNSNHASPQALSFAGRAKAMARLFQRAKDPLGTIKIASRKVLNRTRRRFAIPLHLLPVRPATRAGNSLHCPWPNSNSLSQVVEEFCSGLWQAG